MPGVGGDVTDREESEPQTGLASGFARVLFSPWGIGVSLLVVLAVAIGAPLAINRLQNPPPITPAADADLDRRIRVIQTTVAAITTPTPAPSRRAWILDVEHRDAKPLEYDPPGSQNVFVQSARWLEDGKTVFAITLGFDLIDINGRLQATIAAPPPGPHVSTLAFPIPGTQTVLVWRAVSAKLSIFDIDTRTEQELAPLANASDLSLSPDGSTLAFARKLSDRLDVVLLSRRDLKESLVFSRDGANSAVCCIQWSPDSRKLLMVTGTAIYSQGVRTEAQWKASEVWDGGGPRLWVEAFNARTGTIDEWAGPDRIFRLISSDAPRRGSTVGVFIAVPSGDTTPEQHFDGALACFSPSGRYAVLLHDDNSTEVRDLATGRTVMRVQAQGSHGSCGWSKDEKLLLVSS